MVIATMATSVFTTWANLRDALLDKLASRDFATLKGNVAGNAIEYSSQAEFMQLLDRARTMAALETGQISLRVYAQNGGRG